MGKRGSDSQLCAFFLIIKKYLWSLFLCTSCNLGTTSLHVYVHVYVVFVSLSVC